MSFVESHGITAIEVSPEPVLPPRLKPKIAEVKEVICRAYGVSMADMESSCRKICFAKPRQIAMSLAYELTDASYPVVGRHFGNRDHTTVLFAHRKMRALEVSSEKFAAELAVHRASIANVVANRAPPPPMPTNPSLSADVEEANRAIDPSQKPRSHRWAVRHKRRGEADREAWANLGGEFEPA